MTHHVRGALCAYSFVVVFGVSPEGHWCTVGTDQDAPVCHDVQGDTMTERQPAVVVVAVVCSWFVCCGTRELFR